MVGLLLDASGSAAPSLHGMHIALALAQQLAGPSDFQVVGGQHEACAQVLGFGNRIQSLPCIGGNGLWRWCQQIGVRLVMRPAHATPKLVQYTFTVRMVMGGARSWRPPCYY